MMVSAVMALNFISCFVSWTGSPCRSFRASQTYMWRPWVQCCGTEEWKSGRTGNICAGDPRRQCGSQVRLSVPLCFWYHIQEVLIILGEFREKWTKTRKQKIGCNDINQFLDIINITMINSLYGKRVPFKYSQN